MNILYISSWHTVLECDEIVALSELGYTVFSTGHYLNPHKPIEKEGLRGPIYLQNPNFQLIEEFTKLNPGLSVHGSINLTKDFVNKFDFIIFDHCCPLPMELEKHWINIKHKPVLFRTYGQQGSNVENIITNCYKDSTKFKTIRVAHTESRIPGFTKLDFVIKGYVDSNIYKDWDGFGGEILTFNNFFNQRTYHSNTALYRRILNQLNKSYSLYGLYNEKVDICKGVLTQEKQVEAYQKCGVYFSLGSKPAPLTYSFAEAMSTGCPIITFGKKLGAGIPDIYEVPSLVTNGIDAFYSDNEEEIKYIIISLLTNKNLANQISNNARNTALKLFSKDMVKQQWKEAIESFNSV